MPWTQSALVSAGGMYTWWVQRMAIGQFPKTSTAQLLKLVDVTESGRSGYAGVVRLEYWTRKMILELFVTASVSVKGDRKDSALGEEQGDSDGGRKPRGCSQSPQEGTTLLTAAEPSGCGDLSRWWSVTDAR